MYIAPAANVHAEVLYVSVTNASNATNQQIECRVDRITTLGTPTATTVTPESHEPGDQAASAVVKANVTASEPTYRSDTGGASALSAEGEPSLSGFFWEPAANRTILATNAKPVGVRLITASPVAFDCLVNLTHREIG
jgi:hypothetical protein